MAADHADEREHARPVVSATTSAPTSTNRGERPALRPSQDQRAPDDPERNLRDWELEAQVLGALILDAGLREQAVADGVTADTFHLQKHALVFKAMRSLTPEDHAQGGSLAFVEALRRTGDLDLVGGATAAMALCDWRLHSTESARWAWNEKLLPLQRARVRAKLYEGAARRIREQPDTVGEIEAETARELEALGAARAAGRFSAAAVSAADFCAQDIPKPRSLLGNGVLVAGGFAILYGQPGGGKTWHALDLSRALARGDSWLGLTTPPEGVRVGVLELELGAYSTQARLRVLGVGTHERDGNLRLIPRSALRGSVDLCRPQDVAALREWIKADRLDVLVVDALSRAHTASENKAEELGPVLAALDALRHETGVAIVLIHHERKGNESGSENDLDALRGHSRMQSDPTLLVPLKNSRGLRCIVFAKVSEGPTPEPVWFRIGKDGQPEVVESPEAKRDENRESVLQYVLKAPAPVARGEIATALILTPATTKRHLAALVEAGSVVPIGENRATRYAAPTGSPAHRLTPAHQGARADELPLQDNAIADSAPLTGSGSPLEDRREPAHRLTPALPTGERAGEPVSGDRSHGPAVEGEPGADPETGTRHADA